MFDLAVDFTAILAYSRNDPATGLYKHSATLMTPPVSISSPSCVNIIFQASAALSVSSRFLNTTGTFVKTALYRTLLPVINQWASVRLDVAPPPIASLICASINRSSDEWMCNRSVVIEFRTYATHDGTASAMIADVALLSGACNVKGKYWSDDGGSATD